MLRTIARLTSLARATPFRIAATSPRSTSSHTTAIAMPPGGCWTPSHTGPVQSGGHRGARPGRRRPPGSQLRAERPGREVRAQAALVAGASGNARKSAAPNWLAATAVVRSSEPAESNSAPAPTSASRGRPRHPAPRSRGAAVMKTRLPPSRCAAAQHLAPARWRPNPPPASPPCATLDRGPTAEAVGGEPHVALELGDRVRGLLAENPVFAPASKPSEFS